jgi:uncharacterized protein
MPAKSDALHPAWLNALKDPATYPHPVSQIRIAETHISWVALTGDWAYKLKKPVNFGFVDFSTLEFRQAACREEVRLNRRTAPELYDDVVPLTREPCGPRFGGSGPVLEYAVRMRQFAQEDMLDHRLAREGLSDDVVETLAREVADLHQQAAVALGDSTFGNPDSIRAAVQACLDCLSETPMTDVQRAGLNRLHDWTVAEGLRLNDTFVDRKRRGFVRECHGDLHLGNLVLYRGRPTMFDCLEFNPDLRWIDVMSDVAFLVMDLHDRRASPTAWRVLNVWLELTGDYFGLRVLKYYLAYRALVRAKVAALRLRQPDLSSVEVQSHDQQLHGYIELATTLTRPIRPFLMLMHGVSGSGKSFVARKLAAELGAVQIRSDVERKRLLGGWPSANSGVAVSFDLYSQDATRRTYERLRTLVREIVGSGCSAIVDAAFLRRADRDDFASVAGELGVSFVIVACSAPDSVLRERVLQRHSIGQDPSDADVPVLEKQLATYEPIEPAELLFTVRIDSMSDCTEATIQSVRKHLERTGRE